MLKVWVVISEQWSMLKAKSCWGSVWRHKAVGYKLYLQWDTDCIGKNNKIQKCYKKQIARSLKVLKEVLKAPIPCVQQLLLSFLSLRSEAHSDDNLCEARTYCVGKWGKFKESKLHTVVDSQYLFNGEVSAQLLFPDSAHWHSFLSTDEQLVMKMFLINFYHKMVWWSWLGNWILEWDGKSKTENKIVSAEMLQYFLLGPSSCHISKPENILHFSFSGRLQQSCGAKGSPLTDNCHECDSFQFLQYTFLCKNSKILVKA